MEPNNNFLIIVVQLHVWTSSSPKYMLRIKYWQLFPIQTNYVLIICKINLNQQIRRSIFCWTLKPIQKAVFFLLLFGENSAWALPIPPLSCVTLKTADWGLSCIRIGLSLSSYPWIPFAFFCFYNILPPKHWYTGCLTTPQLGIYILMNFRGYEICEHCNI